MKNTNIVSILISLSYQQYAVQNGFFMSLIFVDKFNSKDLSIALLGNILADMDFFQIHVHIKCIELQYSNEMVYPQKQNCIKTVLHSSISLNIVLRKTANLHERGCIFGNWNI